MVLPKDTFDRPNQAGIGTASDGGVWSVQLPAQCNIIDGKLQTVTSSFTSNYIRRQVTGAPAEYEVAVDIYRPQYTNGCTLVMDSAENDYPNSTGFGYTLSLDSNGGDCIINRRLAGTFPAQSPQFAMATWGSPAGAEFSRITFRRNGATFTVLQDGNVLGVWVDPAPHAETYWIGVQTSRNSERLDNFNVGPVPPIQPGITQAFVDTITPTIPDLWAGLLSQNPRTVQDPLTVELIGQSYSRPEYLVGGLEQDMLFPSVPKGSVVGALGLFDAEVNGDLRFVYVFEEPLVFTNGGYIYIPLESVALHLGVPA